MSVLVVDYHMCNLGSVRRALEEIGAEVIVSDDPADLKKAERLILPGVGSFRDGMTHLRDLGWEPEILNAVREGVPLFGICLGMQLLLSKGREGGETPGLSLISGEVKRLEPEPAGTRIPHVGWNEVHPVTSSDLLRDITDGTDFYFVHSYHAVVENKTDVLATTPYCGGFVSAVHSGNVWGVQFHPEKSGKPGFKLLQNFLKL
ncbi:MAG: imidazole glycerol phosphate synthase subunit HisH [Candidatus Omnitrophota bacterium]